MRRLEKTLKIWEYSEVIKPNVAKYLEEVSTYFKDENSSEMTYRTPFENLLKEIFPREEGYQTQHDQRTIAGNKPDFVVTKNDIPVLYIEVKKVSEDLDKIEKSTQASRYFGYDNLIISDYLSFRFFRNGERYDEAISIGTPNIKNKQIDLHLENDERLIRTIIDFTNSHKERIKSGKHLAKIMGGKAQRIRDNVIEFLHSEKAENAELKKIMNVVKENLIADIDIPKFADMYAQTLVYGLFAARYNDKTQESFSRQEARELISATNPFLQHFFDHIAGASFPKRLDTIVTELCEVFSHADVKELMHEYFKRNDLFGKEHQSPDPVIHFYEDFLQEYDPAKKMEMGVFYTPLPIVRFIVRGVDEILKNEFGIPRGLADASKITIDKKEFNLKGKEVIVQKEYAKVQVLDIATGTGTFLNEVIHHIYNDFKGQEGRWASYVQESLIPRLHGFELMMASYTIAHLKLGMTLQETGVSDIKGRLGVYLTNTLDEPSDYSNQGNLFGLLESIADESKSASRIKKEYPIMVVIGNPPYSGISQNKHYIENNAYKVEPGGQVKLKEKKNWLDDDYVKFIRFGESLIEKNQEGIVGMITSHGYIGNPTFRGMRWHLRNTFDSIYVLDLHGNSNKKEVSPDGSKDENVFDIKTGVSIFFGVKKGPTQRDKKLATVHHAELYGMRKQKQLSLDESSIASIKWSILPEDNDVWRIEGQGKDEYQKGFSVVEIFLKYTTGIVTGIDKLSIFQTKEELQKTTQAILNSANPYTEFGIKDGRRIKKETRLKELREAVEQNTLTHISYRPFDIRYMYYTKGSEVWINSPRPEIMQNFVNKENIGLVFARTQKNSIWNAVFVSSFISEAKLGESSTQSMISPLYLYLNSERIPNLQKQILEKINVLVGETKPEDIFDYIYAYLYSPSYREKYKEFLKTDFPRVPYPKTKEEFWNLVPFGTKLRELHLLNDPIMAKPITTFSVTGSNEVEKINYKNGNVYINESQYFGDVPEVAWNFYIGGYQPAQKWLKDRKGKALSNADIEHYQKMIVSLLETNRIMKVIDTIIAF